MSLADQRGTTLTEVLVGMMLIGYVTVMLLQVVASASSVDAKIRARTEAWQTVNAVATPAQHVDCAQPARLDVCKPNELLGYSVELRSYPTESDVPLNDQEYTHTGQFGTYTITLNDEKQCLPDTTSSPPSCSDDSEVVPTRTVTIKWRPDGSAPETIDHTVYGPWS